VVGWLAYRVAVFVLLRDSDALAGRGGAPLRGTGQGCGCPLGAWYLPTPSCPGAASVVALNVAPCHSPVGGFCV
jgi:hypothetical protein